MFKFLNFKMRLPAILTAGGVFFAAFTAFVFIIPSTDNDRAAEDNALKNILFDLRVDNPIVFFNKAETRSVFKQAEKIAADLGLDFSRELLPLLKDASFSIVLFNEGQNQHPAFLIKFKTKNNVNKEKLILLLSKKALAYLYPEKTRREFPDKSYAVEQIANKNAIFVKEAKIADSSIYFFNAGGEISLTAVFTPQYAILSPSKSALGLVNQLALRKNQCSNGVSLTISNNLTEIKSFPLFIRQALREIVASPTQSRNLNLNSQTNKWCLSWG